MPGSIRICRIFGVDINIHFSLFLILGLIVFLLSGQFASFIKNVFPEALVKYPYIAIFTGFIAGVSLFASVLAHELTHCLTAMKLKKRVRGIYLFFLGGVSLIDGLETSSKDSLIVSVAGPISSFVLGALFFIGQFFVPDHALGFYLTKLVLKYLCFINIALGVFNILPIFPMDGGRALVSVLNLSGLTEVKSVVIAANASILICFGVVIFCLYDFLFLNGFFLGFQSIWLLFISGFLIINASGEKNSLKFKSFLRQEHLSNPIFWSRIGPYTRDYIVECLKVAADFDEKERDEIFFPLDYCLNDAFPAIQKHKFVFLYNPGYDFEQAVARVSLNKVMELYGAMVKR